MKDNKATRQELLAELAELRRRVTQLEQSDLELQQVKNELRKSQQYLEAAFHATLDGVCLVDSQGIILALNDKAAERLGRKKDELLGNSLFDFLPPDLAKDRRKTFETILKTGRPLKAERRSFPGRFSRNSGYPIFGLDGAVEAVIVYSQDITEEKRAEQAFVESEQRYRLLAENSLTGIFLYQDGAIVYVNKRGAEIVGYEREDILGKSGWEFVHPEDVRNLERRFAARSRHENIAPQYQLRVLTKEGKTKWIEVIAVRTQWQGRSTILGNVIDITDRKEAEDALYESEERYRQLVDLCPDGILVHAEGRYVFANHAMAKILGLPSPKEIIGRQIFDFIHPKYHQIVTERVRAQMEKGEAVPSMEEQYVRADGTIVDVEVTAAPFVFNGQKASQVVVRDISERKKADQALSESQAMLANILRASPVGISYAEQGKLKWINRAMFEIFGGRKEGEWQDKSLREYYASDEEYKRVQALFFKRLREGAPTATEAVFKRWDGSEFHGYLRAVVLDPRNPRKGTITTIADISDRKRAELERELERQKFQIMAENAPLGIAVIDQDGTFQYLNPKFTNLFGYGLEDIPNGRQWLRSAFPEPGYRREVVTAWLHEFAGPGVQTARSRIFTVKCKDGTEKIVHFRPVKLPTGPYLMTCEDITDLKRAEYLLDQQRDLCSGLSSVSEMKHALNLCIETAIRISHMDAAGIYVVDDDGSLRLVAHKGVTDEFVAAVSRLGSDTPAARLLREGKPFYPKYAITSQVRAAMQREGLRAAGVIPILHEGRVIACLYVSSHTLEEVPLSDRDAFETVAGQLGSAIARLKAEEGGRASARMLQSILATTPVGIALSQNRRMKWVNRAWAEMFGFENEDECINIEAGPLYASDEDYKRVGMDLQDLRDGILVETDAKMKRKDGSTFDAHLRFNDLDPNDHSKGTISAITDISQRKQMEEALLQTERLQAVADLASGVAHNFNNLLQIVVGSADLALLDLDLGDLQNVKQALTQILETSRFGAETVKRLQSFAHIRAEAQAGESHVFDLSEVAKQACEMSAPWWKTKPEKEGIKISLDSDLMSGCLIRGKKSELFEVLVNLIKNAAEAMPQGGQVTVKTAVRNGQVVLAVWDTGIGIPKQDLKKIFDPFWSTKGVKGTGMGLAITYGIVSRHGGTISVQSKEGAGSTFTIRLPLAEETPELQPSETKAFDVKLSILAIDDMLPIVLMLEQLLTKCGHTVFKAVSGREGIEIFREKDIDLVICDLGMPGMNGWDVGKAIRAICQERGVPKTPFVLLTGWGGQSLEEDKVEESGVDTVIEKPLDIPRLLKVIEQAVRRGAMPSTDKS